MPNSKIQPYGECLEKVKRIPVKQFYLAFEKCLGLPTVVHYMLARKTAEHPQEVSLRTCMKIECVISGTTGGHRDPNYCLKNQLITDPTYNKTCWTDI